jgi:hypothetical protein
MLKLPNITPCLRGKQNSPQKLLTQVLLYSHINPHITSGLSDKSPKHTSTGGLSAEIG